ncbi:hypothetical protein [Chryseolinea soli]|uniref:Uncharacterized protein n=1 Tax=Chryseolinea soli TaxID=2321403 RepID=A0A385ST59_9BACT|nr:hypothetical protein [Chryseolinea soli]AYB31988.1 hypothetical protein D4L85_16075 [Chryseolinea soli]
MAYKYLYIDDLQGQIEQGTINGLQDGGEIEIAFSKPKLWEELLSDLEKNLPGLDGIILDLRLNQEAFEKGKFAMYRGSTVAQELRTLAKESTPKNDFPIILISANENIEKSLDQTSLDLFDFTISKNEIGHKPEFSFKELRSHLKWLVDGYRYLNSSKKQVEPVLNLKDVSILDFRFVEHLRKLLDKPVHIVAGFLIHKVISKPTFLINEDYLSARLGIDMTSDDWSKLSKGELEFAIYNGAFSGYNTRWIMPLLELWWEDKISKQKSLRTLGAADRVALIAEKTGLKNLKPLVRQGKAKSDSFWVVCKATKVPIDTSDGFVIEGQDHNFPWQEVQYVSIDEALRPSKPDIWKDIAAIEKDRFKNLKNIFEKQESHVRK